jgi:sugar phosphate isomerase/epimerase
MRKYGFSTGALAKGNIERALAVVQPYRTDAIEYSALRSSEIASVAEYLLRNGVGDFDYVAFHAPSSLAESDEPSLIALIEKLLSRFEMTVVVHPDVLRDLDLWRRFGSSLAIENMDHRKPIGRTARELDSIFQHLPAARLCFDIGHAHEIDRTMALAYDIIRRHGHRIAHIHASEVSDECSHRAFSASSRSAFARFSSLLPVSAPVILETVSPEAEIGRQLTEARRIFAPPFAQAA